MGSVNVLINCAGMNTPKRHWRDLDIADWHRIVAVNLNGVANTVCATLPFMRDQQDGLIINIASWAAKHEFPSRARPMSRQNAALSTCRTASIRKKCTTISVAAA
ncbi:short-chain dehydrogenase/reductase SDR [Thalassospira sp. KO164]|nr:short-chain dehydrogenase/reductase SDR [Thalassospira sp. KO164]